MTIDNWLRRTTKKLSKANVATAHLDCLILLEDETAKDRSWLLAHSEYILKTENILRLNKKIIQRMAHEPLAYIRHKTEFYGREFYIDHNVLEPRPESEAMIEMLTHLSLPLNAEIVDIGTGSGALAITAKLELPPKYQVTGIDINPSCLKVASQNADTLGAAIHLLQGNLLEPFNSNYGHLVLLCNLPYVPDTYQINPAAMHEPPNAIFGGSDGLDLYRELFNQLKKICSARSALVLTESMPPQHKSLENIALDANFSLRETNDFVQLFKKDSGDCFDSRCYHPEQHPRQRSR